MSKKSIRTAKRKKLKKQRLKSRKTPVKQKKSALPVILAPVAVLLTAAGVLALVLCSVHQKTAFAEDAESIPEARMTETAPAGSSEETAAVESAAVTAKTEDAAETAVNAETVETSQQPDMTDTQEDEPSEPETYDTITEWGFTTDIITEHTFFLPLDAQITRIADIMSDTDIQKIPVISSPPEEEDAPPPRNIRPAEDDTQTQRDKPAEDGKDSGREENNSGKEEEKQDKQDRKKDGYYYISVYDTFRKKVVEMELEDYVLHVLAGEMSADKAHFEALKAQAIAIRSYALAKDRTGSSAHHGAQTCTNYAHCMAFKKDSDYRSIPSSYRKLYEQAVAQTRGQVLTYDGRIAQTFFHDCSYGYTDSCADVFGMRVPYLVPVFCGYETEKIVTVKFTCRRMLEKLLGAKSGSELYARLEDEEKGFDNVVENESGRIGTVDICGRTFKGTYIRTALELRSTKIDFAYDPESEVFTLTVYGFGHGVGLSQETAKQLAREGSTYSQILSTFYPGTVLTALTEKTYPKY